MSRLKGNFYFLLVIPAAFIANFGAPLYAQDLTSKMADNPQTPQRYVKLDINGRVVQNSTDEHPWHCVLDTNTSLIWETKTRDGGLQDANHTYSWYVTDNSTNGGFPGYQNKGICPLEKCNTQSYIDSINQNKLCNVTTWRLPTREELRSLVNYQIKYPGPVIDQYYFPNTSSQFYWSAVPDANDKDSAWGIGFSFGYDYAYFKSDHGYVRLVSEAQKQ